MAKKDINWKTGKYKFRASDVLDISLGCIEAYSRKPNQPILGARQIAIKAYMECVGTHSEKMEYVYKILEQKGFNSKVIECSDNWIKEHLNEKTNKEGTRIKSDDDAR